MRETEEEKVLPGDRARYRRNGGSYYSTTYQIKPRYSTLNARYTESEEEANKCIAEEIRMYELAIKGESGPALKQIAENIGKACIVEKCTRSAAGVTVEDLIVKETPSFTLTYNLDVDLSGLWELTCPIENDEADRRIKNDWRVEPIWKEGTRFALNRNDSGYEDLLAILEEEGVEVSQEKKDKLRRAAGYLVTRADGRWRHHNKKLADLPEDFGLSLRSVRISSMSAAYDLVSPDEHCVRKVLAYLVDKRHAVPAYRVATLLEQQQHGEGPFRAEDEDA